MPKTTRVDLDSDIGVQRRCEQLAGINSEVKYTV